MDYGLRLPFSKFVCDVLNFYGRAPSQYTAHFLLLSILEDINNSQYGPVTLDDIRSYFFVKQSGSRYMIFKRSYRKHVCLFLTRPSTMIRPVTRSGEPIPQRALSCIPTSPTLIVCLLCLTLSMLLFFIFHTQLFMFACSECDVANTPLKKHIAKSLDSFCDLPAKTRRQLCYAHPSVVCKVFLTGIEQLGTQPSKGDIDRIVEHTKLDLAKIRAEQLRRKTLRAKMIAEELLVLSDSSGKTVDGAEEFDVAGHEKGMRLGALPKDANSGYQPSSDGLMVKETTRRSLSRTSSRNQGTDQAAAKPSFKKSKRKAASEGEQAEAEQEQATEGD